MSLPEFKLVRPRTTAEAVSLLAQHGPDAQVVAGGTDLIPSMRQRLFEPKFVLDIRGIAELRAAHLDVVRCRGEAIHTQPVAGRRRGAGIVAARRPRIAGGNEHRDSLRVALAAWFDTGLLLAAVPNGT